MKYSVGAFDNLRDSGIDSKLKKVSSALGRVSKNFKPLAVYEHHLFAINEETNKVYKFEYEILPRSVKFSSPELVVIERDSSLNEQRDMLIENAVDALFNDKTGELPVLQNRLINVERKENESNKFFNTLDKEFYASKSVRKRIGKIVESIASKRTISGIKSAKRVSHINELFNGGSTTVELYKSRAKEDDPRREFRNRIIEARKQAKNLYINPNFNNTVKSIVEFNHQSRDYMDIVENHQEFFTLTVAEQADLLRQAANKNNVAISWDNILNVVENLTKLGLMKIRPEIEQIHEIFDANWTNWAKKINMFEAQMNVPDFSKVNLSEVAEVLKKVITENNDIVSNELMAQFKTALANINEMIKSGLIDEGRLEKALSLLHQYMPSKMNIGEDRKAAEDDDPNKDETIYDDDNDDDSLGDSDSDEDNIDPATGLLVVGDDEPKDETDTDEADDDKSDDDTDNELADVKNEVLDGFGDLCNRLAVADSEDELGESMRLAKNLVMEDGFNTKKALKICEVVKRNCRKNKNIDGFQNVSELAGFVKLVAEEALPDNSMDDTGGKFPDNEMDPEHDGLVDPADSKPDEKSKENDDGERNKDAEDAQDDDKSIQAGTKPPPDTTADSLVSEAHDDLFIKAKRGDESILKDPNVSKVKDRDGQTPLHWLAFKGVEAALKHPDAKKVKDSEGQTPADIWKEIYTA